MIDQIIIGNGESYLKAVFNEIDTWYKGNEKTLNIYTVPFNSICIFKEIILKVVLMNNRVMYICNDKDKIKKSFNNIFKNQYTSIEKNIVIKEYNSYFKVDDKYELIIYDDISSYSNLTKEEIISNYKRIQSIANKIIVYSVKAIEEIKYVLNILPLREEPIFVEPRIIKTRIDLNKTIPNKLYEYFKWFILKKKKVIIFVDKIEKEKSIHKILEEIFNKNEVNIINSQNYLNKYDLILNNKSIFIIISDMEVMLKYSHIENIVVLFADEDIFSYKKLLYICGYVEKLHKEFPEVLFVCNRISNNINTVKTISREFNKVLWREK